MEIKDFELCSSKFSQSTKIGSGSFSQVYLSCSNQGDKVAIKVIKKNHDKRSLLYAKKQARILRGLNNLSVCNILGTYESQNNFYIISKYYQGPTLAQIIYKLNKKQTIGIILRLLQILQYLKNKGIMHRDLKPQNIICTQNRLVLIDFGFACQIPKNDETIISDIVGTPNYMSPELLKAQKYNSKSQLWSIGVMIYQMVYGCLPWSEKSEKALLRAIKIKSPLKLPNDSLNFLIKKCLIVNSTDRIQWQQLFSFAQKYLKLELLVQEPQRNQFCSDCIIF